MNNARFIEVGADVRYWDDAALHAARPDMDGLPVTAHAALLARVRLALLARGHAVVIEYA